MGAENGFGTISVVGIEIPHRDPGGTKLSLGGECRDGDAVEITKSHRFAGGRVVTGRTHERKNRGAMVKGVFRDFEGGGDGAAGVVGDAGEIGRVGIEVARLREPLYVRGCVGQQQGFVGDGSDRYAPRPVGMGGAQVGGGPGDAGGLLGAHRGAVGGALRIVQEKHGRNRSRFSFS